MILFMAKRVSVKKIDVLVMVSYIPDIGFYDLLYVKQYFVN
jgi:hypothetical protein